MLARCARCQGTFTTDHFGRQRVLGHAGVIREVIPDIDHAFIDGAIGPRSVVTITLSADHRVSDGHAGALFLAEIGRLLQEPDKL